MASFAGKCPKCEGLVTSLKIKTLEANCEGRRYKAVTYNCPLCSTVLSASMDPVALAAETANRVAEKIRG